MNYKTALRWTCLVVVLIFASACSRSAADYLLSAKKYFDAGKYDDAILLYRKAIQKDPKSGEAYYRLALAELKQGKIGPAYQAMTEASVFSTDNEEIQRVFADFCFELYLLDPKHPKAFYDNVSNISQRLLARDKRSYDGLRLKGYLALADKKPPEAIDDLRQADQLRPAQPQVVLPLAQALIEDHQDLKAEQVAQAFLQKNKNFGPMYDVLYGIYARAGRQQDAENILKAKADSNPKQAGYVLTLANYYWGVKRHDDAQRTLQRLIDNPKDYQHPRALVGDFYLAVRDLAEARHQYEEGIKSEPKDRAFYQKKIVNLLILEGKKDDAKKLVDDLASANPKDDEVQLVRAAMWIESGKPQDVDAAINALKPLVEKKPEDANRHYRLGQAYQLKGNFQQAEAEWRASIKDNPASVQARVALAEMDLQNRNFSAALTLTDEVLSREPQHQGARFLRALALAGLTRAPEARQILTELLREAPNSAIAKLAMGRLDILEKRYPEAEKQFLDVYRLGQADPRPLDGLLTTYLAEKEPAKATALLQKELRAAPENPSLIARWAELNLVTGNPALALSEYQGLLAKNPNSPRLNRRVGEVAILAKDENTALRSLQRAVNLDPKDSVALAEMGSLLLGNGQKREALDTFRKVLALNPDQPAIQNNVAYLIAETGGDTNEAMDLARKALQKAPNDPHLNDTIGYIYLKQNHNDSAVQTFRAVVNKNPDVAAYRLHYATALLTQGDKEKARVELQAALMRNPQKDEESEIKSLLARIGQ